MDELARWLDRQRSREQRIVFLEDALLGDRFRRYAAYRLRYFFLRLGAESAVHIIRFLFLLHIFAEGHFIALLLLHAAAGLTTSFWWGALEVMRGRVRELHRSGRPHLIPREIGRWLSFATQASLTVGAASIAWLLWEAWRRGLAIEVIHLYAFAVLVKLSLDFVVRCYHSGIYSLRRIYRPPLAIVGVELAGFAGTLALWPLMGSWGLPTAMLASTFIAAAVTVHYTRRSYRFSRFAPFSFLEMRRVRAPWRHFGAEGLFGGLAYATASLDGVLLVALFLGSGAFADDQSLFILFFILAPIVRAGAEWARLFYFDLKRLEVEFAGDLRQRFERHMTQLSWALGAGLGGLAVLVGMLVRPGDAGSSELLLLLFFFVPRSVLGAVQIQAFSERSYRPLLQSGVLVALGYGAIGTLPVHEAAQMLMLGGLTLGVAALLRGRHGVGGPERKALWPGEWVLRLSRVREPVRLGVVRTGLDLHRRRGGGRQDLSSEQRRWWREQLAREVATRTGPAGAATVLRSGHIVWYQAGDGSPRVTEDWVLSRGGGYLASVESGETHTSGPEALAAAIDRGLFGDDVALPANGGATGFGVEQLRQMFQQAFPNGVVFDPEAPTPLPLLKAPSSERRQVLVDAMRFARELTPQPRRSHFEVTAFVDKGNLRLVFLIDGKAPLHTRREWTRVLRRSILTMAADGHDDSDSAGGEGPVRRSNGRAEHAP